MRRLAPIIVMSLVLLFIPDSIASAKTPYQRPLVTKIVTKKTSPSYVSVIVYAKTVGQATPKQNIKVTIGNKSCTIRVSYGSCSIKKIKLNSRIKIKVKQFNKYGSGTVDTKSIKANVGSKVYFLAKGTSSLKSSKGKVLSTSSAKTTGIQAFNKAPASRNSQTSAFVSGQGMVQKQALNDPNQVLFDFSDAVALAKPETTSGTSGFYKIAADGSQSDPLINGVITVDDYYIAPNDDVYAKLNSSQSLVPGGPTCILVKIDPQTGEPICIDASLNSITFPQEQPGKNSSALMPPPIQFDGASNIYYSGTAGDKTVLRRHSGGVSVDLINQNMSLTSYFVAPSGDVIMCGSTLSSQQDWLRKISPSGRISTISNGVMCNFMKKFTDGKLWIGAWGQGNGPMGVLKYDLASGKLSSWTEAWSLTRDPEQSLDGYIPGIDQNPAFSSSGGAFAKDIFLFPSAKTTWVIAGQDHGSLVRYSPSLLFAESSISNYQMGIRVLNTLVLTGTNQSDTNLLMLFDTQSGNETVVFNGSNEIEIYDMAFVAGTNKLMFSGLRFSDGQYVVGEVSL